MSVRDKNSGVGLLWQEQSSRMPVYEPKFTELLSSESVRYLLKNGAWESASESCTIARVLLTINYLAPNKLTLNNFWYAGRFRQSLRRSWVMELFSSHLLTAALFYIVYAIGSCTAVSCMFPRTSFC